MINRNTNNLEQRLSFAVYGLISLLVIVLLSVFILLENQRNNFIELNNLSNKYHQQNIDNSLELLRELSLFKLRIRDYLLTTEGDDSDAVQQTNRNTNVNIRTTEIRYWISQTIQKIVSYQQLFQHPEFEMLITNLQVTSDKALHRLTSLDSLSEHSIKAYDTSLNNLQYVLEQLYQLHTQENHSIKQKISLLENNNKSQLFQVILFLAIITILGGYKILSYIRKLFRELSLTQTDLLISSRQLNNAQRLADIGSWEINFISGRSALSSQLKHIFHLPKDITCFSEDDYISMVHPDDKQKLRNTIDKSLSLRESYSIEYRILVNANEYKDISETCELSYGIKDTLKSCLRTFQDITARKKIDNELQNHRHKLEMLVSERTQALKNTQDELILAERLATLGELTATVSHELRNPLSAMRPSLYILEKTGNKNDEAYMKAIGRIDRNISRCDNIIDELLDFTKISKFKFENVLLDPWLETLLEEQNLPLGISIVKELGLTNIGVAFDSERLRRAVINIVDNACHSMSNENKELFTNKITQLGIKTEIAEQQIKIIVSDTGCGMSEQIQNKVFEPLFSTKGFGVGLGMPTVKKIMQQHNGGIDITSQQGIGTQVTLWFPNNTLQS